METRFKQFESFKDDWIFFSIGFTQSTQSGRYRFIKTLHGP